MKPRRWMDPSLVAGALAALVLLRETVHLARHWDKLGAAGDDFHFYWEAVERFRADPHALYIPPALMDLRGFLYPPPAIMMFLPLAALSRGAAGEVFRIAGILAMLGSVWLLIDLFETDGLEVGPSHRVCLMLVAVAFGATFTNMFYGQVNTFVLLDCLAFRRLLDRKRPALAGAVLAAGAWLKLYPALCLLFVFLWERRNHDVRRMLAGFALGLAGIVVALLPLVPTSLYRVYFKDILPASANGTFQNILMQSWLGAAARTLGHASDYLDWVKCDHSIVPQTWARVVNALLILGALGLGWWTRTRRLVGFLCLLAMVPIISPLGWAYVYVLAAPALLFALVTAPRTAWSLALVLAAAIGFYLPITHQATFIARLPDVLQHVFYDRYLVLTLVVVAWLLGRPRPAVS